MDLTLHPIIAEVRTELARNADQRYVDDKQRFFKEEVNVYGVTAPTVRKISKAAFKAHLKNTPKTLVFDLCEILWQSGYNEEFVAACDWSYAMLQYFEPADLDVFERWLHRYVSNWAACDTLCNHTVGEFLEMYPDKITRLHAWAKSENRWVKRAAGVSLIIPARRGLFLEDIFAIADILLLDGDDMVQKGYGWMLKAASEHHQRAVFEYVLERRKNMPRTALRYAIEKMPAELRKQAMAKE